MPRFELARAARADLDDIADYSVARWGKAQAATYIDTLEARLQELAERPRLGRKRGELARGLLSFPFESHVIFDRRASFGIHVVRILHQRQDAPRHLR